MPLPIPPRWYLNGVQGEVVVNRLYGYWDALLCAYAAFCLWIAAENSCLKEGKFVVSIPRLELACMTDGYRNLTPELKISYHCFAESKIALCWIHNVEKVWKPFVQNRVSKVRKLLHVECWRHVSGLKIPADIPSRGAIPLTTSD